MSVADNPSGQPGLPPSGGGTGGGGGGGPVNLADLKQLGRYKLLRELGRGAMGIVFEAVDPKIGRKVALKVLTSVPGVSAEELEEFRSRFFREARTAGMLSHPNIVVIHDVDHEEQLGISYMAMEFLKGQTLYDLLRSGVKFTREQSIDLCVQVAEGLDHAHRQGVIHRDVKPGNLMLLEDGTIKITDFGIAKISTSNLTKTGQFLGTPNYMSPEQVIGHVIDGRSDLFGLGIILYELLTGEKPFMGSSLTTITYQIVNVDPIEPSKIQPGIPKVFDQIVGTLLKKAPDERFQTGKAVAEALRAARDSLGAGPARPSGPSPADLATRASRPGAAGDPTMAASQPAASGVPVGAGPSLLAGLPGNRLLLAGIAAVFLTVAAVLVVLSLRDSPETPPTATVASGPPATEPAVPPSDSGASPTGAGTPSTGSEGVPVSPPQAPVEATTPPAETTATTPQAVDVAPVAKPAVTPSAVKPAAPRPKPEPEPELVPRMAEPLPLRPRATTPAPAVATGFADVTLHFEHKLKSGTLWVVVDGVELVRQDFEADKKKGGNLLEDLRIPEGSHLVRCCLSSADMKDGQMCAQQQHPFVMNTKVTIRALHQKPPLGKDKFSFSIE